MNIKALKTTGLSIALAAFLFGAGAAGSSTAFAQGWQGRDRGHDNRLERREERRGYNDGLIKGRRDALAHRKFNPNAPGLRFNSNDYREGFRDGYTQAYRQYANNHGHRNPRGF